jgi:hypothetical protein
MRPIRWEKGVLKMTFSKHHILKLIETDLDFLIQVVSPEVSDKSGLKRIIREDEDFRNRFLIFDTQDVADLFRKENILDYMAVMLSSFTRIESYSISPRHTPPVVG